MNKEIKVNKIKCNYCGDIIVSEVFMILDFAAVEL